MLLELLRHGYRHGLAHLHHSPNIHAHFPQTPSLTLQHFALVEPWLRPLNCQTSLVLLVPTRWFEHLPGLPSRLPAHYPWPNCPFSVIHFKSYLVLIPILQSWFKYPLPCPFVPPRRPPSSTPFPRSILSSGAAKACCSLVVIPSTRGSNLRNGDVLE